MVLYENLGYTSLEDYKEDFVNSLLITNHNFEFFVNWDKIFNKLKENVTEISILNSLNKIPEDEIESHFRELISCYPEVVPILPSILAIRYEKNKKYIVEVFDGEFKEYDFNDETFNVDDIVFFCKKTGLLNLFSEISDLYTYLLGTEVGLDTNSRKNRSGTTYESLLEELFEEVLEDYDDYEVFIQEYVNNIDRVKRADFIISFRNHQKVIIECNFYNSTGSKPIEVANAYIDLQKQLYDENLIFLWVTDGQGWKKMGKTLDKVIPQIDYILNYNMLKKHLKKILELDK